MLQDLQWDGCRKETDYYEKSYGSRRNSNFRDTQVDIEDNSWSFAAGLRTAKIILLLFAMVARVFLSFVRMGTF
mgnify:CR=1 FL=1